MIRSLNYQFQLPGFAGPLDLLLRLIEKEELAITTISITAVTDQYLAHLAELEKIEPGAISEFIVIAARLLQIKAEALLPRPPGNNSGEESAAEELARQLREYRLIKEATKQLQEWDGELRRAHLRSNLSGKEAARLSAKEDNGLNGVALVDLVALMQKRLQMSLPLNPDGPPPPTHTYTLEAKAKRIEQLLEVAETASFENLLAECASQIEMIVLFMALLELWRSERIVIQQETIFGDIIIRREERSSGSNQQENEKE